MFCLLVCCLMLGVFSFCLMCVFKALFKLASQGKEIEILEAGEASSAAPASAARAKRALSNCRKCVHSRACKKAKLEAQKEGCSKDELVQSDNAEEKAEAAAGLLTEI